MMLNKINVNDVLDQIEFDLVNDLNLYDIKAGSNEHFKLIAHHILVYTFNLKQKDPDSRIIFNLENIKIKPELKRKIQLFIHDLHYILPNIFIKETEACPIFIKILNNLNQKATKKKVNIGKLKKLSKTYGLTEINNIYLNDPSLLYKITL